MKVRINIAMLVLIVTSIKAHTALNYHDIFPVYKSKSAFELMNEEQKEIIKDSNDQRGIYERIQISSTIVAEKATYARDLNKVKVLAGDLHGPLNMIGLTYGTIPTGATQPALLTTAAALPLTAVAGATVGDATYSDLNQNFGFFSLPTKYRKMGARFNFSLRILSDFCLSFQTGVVDMKQTLTHYTDKTSNAAVGDVFYTGGDATLFTADKVTIEQNLMDKRTAIFQQMGINGEDWNKTGAEDVSGYLTWRHNFKVNQDADPKDWAAFIFTPHIKIGGTFAVGKEKNPDILLSLPFGNNGHHAFHASGGFGIDFYESIECSVEGGITHFFNRTYTTRVPNHKLQSLLFPYKTTVKVEPGKTWHVSLCMNAFHFMDKLSLFTQYSYINHQQDTISLVTADAAFLPKRLQDQTACKVQLANIGLNYDLSPNMTFGFLWQAPIAQRASYKTHTFLLSGVLTF